MTLTQHFLRPDVSPSYRQMILTDKMFIHLPNRNINWTFFAFKDKLGVQNLGCLALKAELL